MKSALAGVLAGLLLCSTISPVAASDDTSNVVETTLENGLRVIVVPNALAPVVSTTLTYGVGSVDDPIRGTAHATEHMMFRGTSETSSDQFANVATRIGAQYNADTSYTHTHYYFTFPSAYLNVVLRLEADRMQHLTISQADWSNERGAVEQEVKAHLSNPLEPVMEKVNAVFFGDSLWAKDPVGTIDGFERMTSADIAQFYHTWYHPNNATLVVAGDVDPAAAIAAVREQFGAIPAATLPSHPPLAIQPLKTTNITQKIDFPLPVALSAFRLPGLSDPDYAATRVLFDALESARGPFADLVLSGKVLFAQAVQTGYAGVGTGTLVAVTRPGADPASALAALDGALNAYAQNGVPDDLIEATKARIAASQAYDASTIPGESLEWAYSRTLYDKTPAEQYAALASVTPADVSRVLRKYVLGTDRVTLILAANPGASISKAVASGKEDVAVTATDGATLPAWSASYFAAPLSAPKLEGAPKIFHLKNGMTIAVRRETSAPVVVMAGEILTNTDMNEPRGKDGVAYVTNGLMNLGTTAHDYKAYQAELDAISEAASLGSSFTARIQSSNFERGVQLLAEGELHPGFAGDKFALVQQNTEQTLKAAESLPDTKAALTRLYALYPPNDPHRRHATSASVSAVTLDDVKRWYAFAYRPELTTVSVVGDIDPDAVHAAFEKYFGSWSVKGPEPVLEYPPIRMRRGKRMSTTVTSTTTKQADVTLEQSLPLRRGDRDEIALSLANTILSGEGTGSMLFHDVRKKKGYVYSIDSSLDVARSGSTFQLNYASDTKNIEAAARAAVATIQHLRTYPPSDTDLVLAKAMLLSRYVVPLASYDGVAGALLESAQEDLGERDIAKYYADVLNTTPQDIQRAMKRWIDPAKFTRVEVVPTAQ